VSSNRAPARPGEASTLVADHRGRHLECPDQRPSRPQSRFPAVHADVHCRRTEYPVSSLVGPNITVMSYVVRSTTSLSGLMRSVRRAVASVDPQLAVAQVGALQAMLDRASAQMAFTMVLLAIAACVALTLGVIGIYGVISYVVTQRTGEIGVRLALGAEPASISRMIVRQGGLVAVAGITIGLATALAGSRLIESPLYGVSARDPRVLTVTTVTLLTVAPLACWLPARRAARLNPLEALRAD
jgi:putative ABC transport system permease protein